MTSLSPLSVSLFLHHPLARLSCLSVGSVPLGVLASGFLFFSPSGNVCLCFSPLPSLFQCARVMLCATSMPLNQLAPEPDCCLTTVPAVCLTQNVEERLERRAFLTST